MNEPENEVTEIVQISSDLYKIGRSYRSIDNQFKLATAVQLLETGEKVTVKDWGTCFGNDPKSKHGRRKSRQQIRLVRNHLRAKGAFVVGYYNNILGHDGKLLPNGELIAIRLFRPEGDEGQRQAIIEQIDKLEAQRNRMLSEEEFAKAHLQQKELALV